MCKTISEWKNCWKGKKILKRLNILLEIIKINIKCHKKTYQMPYVKNFESSSAAYGFVDP